MTRSPTRKATLVKRCLLRVENGMTATRAQIEGPTEEEASQEAKDHTEATITLVIKAVAAGKPLRVKGRISPVMGPEHKHPVDVVDQTTEVVTPIVTRRQQQEITEVNLIMNNQAGALDGVDHSAEEEEAQGGE